MRPMKAVFGLWQEIQIGQLNKLLKPFGCKLEKTTSKKWGDQVSITASALVVPEAPVDHVRPHEHLWEVSTQIAGCDECSVCHQTRPTVVP